VDLSPRPRANLAHFFVDRMNFADAGLAESAIRRNKSRRVAP
jgi:hypothetical protein